MGSACDVLCKFHGPSSPHSIYILKSYKFVSVHTHIDTEKKNDHGFCSR